MNYITEINRFNDWLETNDIPKSAVALWYALMHVNNKADWKESFEVAVSVLEFKTKFKRSELFEARNVLTQKGRITWKQRGGNLCATYSMVPFSVHNTDAIAYTKAYTSADTIPDSKPTQTGTINKTKQKLEKTKPTKPPAASEVSFLPAIDEALKKFGPQFFLVWQRWKDYKVKDFKFKFKTEDSEKTAVEHLFSISAGNAATAEQIIAQSIRSGWKGLFELKAGSVSPGSQAAAPPVPPPNNDKKTEGEINYLYERFLDGEVTQISIYPTHWNFLKGKNKIDFDNDLLEDIQRQAVELIGEKKEQATDADLKNCMKRIGVIEFFKKAKSNSIKIIFN